MSKLKFPPEIKILACEDFLSGKYTSAQICKKYGITYNRKFCCSTSLRNWVIKYKASGVDAFLYPQHNNRSYSSKLKKQAVEEYLSGKVSISEAVARYDISDTRVFRRWISQYNANKGLKDYDPQGKVYMAEARRKTTQAERKEIVEYCITHNRDYKGTASLYDVSYSQVYSWVKKYDTAGESGLADKRGHHKADNEVDELERLRRENLRLKHKLEEKDMVVELLKKNEGIRRGVRLGKRCHESRYLAVKYFHEKEQWSINWMCRQLNICRAAYYKWLHQPVPEQELENIKLAELIKEYDERFGHILGYRRMTNWINHFNHTSYSKNRVHRIMKMLGVHSVIRRKKKKYHASKPEATADNKLKRDFSATRPNEKWATDVTEFKVPETGKKLYLSAIFDLYDRFPVAYVVSKRNDNKLVFDTYDKALAKNPTAKPLFHSDRGYQYTSRAFQNKLQKQGMNQSMSRVGHCIDNGPTEGLWGIIKSEMYCMYQITDEYSLRTAIDNYMKFYAEERPQERFHCKTPAEVRQEALLAENPAQYPIAPNKRIEAYKAKWCA